MATRRKTYRFRNGKILEIEENHDGNYGAPGKLRIKKRKPTEEQMRLVNANNKAKRCRHKLLEYFSAGDCFGTWTYAVPNRPPDMPSALKDFQKAIRTVRLEYRKRGKELFWIRNIERGTKGAWHIHFVVNEIGDTASIMQKAWKKGGTYTIKIDASDNDGNAAVQKSVTFKIDTVPPTLSITSPVDGHVTNQAACTVKGTTNDATSSPVNVTVKLNNGSAESITVGSDGGFSKNLTLVEGSNTITIVAADSAGKSTTVTRNVKLDTSAPVIKSVTLTPNPVDAGKTFVISVEVTD